MKKNLLYRFWILLMFVGILFSTGTYGQATLKHSYTFEEGTYEGTTIYDQAGSLDGTMTGSAISIADGKCVVSGATSDTDGYVVFDGVTLDLASYSAVTLEAFIETGEVLNTSYTMLAYFGSTAQGTNCFWIQPTRAATETRIEANNGTTTITALLNGYEVDDGEMHHLVAILSGEALTYYLDGIVIAETSTNGADYISTLGTDIAQLFKGPDGWPDPNYNCWLEEFNIYDGVLDQHTIAQTAGEYLGLDLTNASLDTLTISVGTMEPAFDPETDIYEVTVPYGTTTLTISVDPAVGGVSITMFDGLGVELEEGVVTFNKDDGMDVEVIVTALDGVSEKSYYVSIFPEEGESCATLESIDVSVGNLIGDFLMDSTHYTALVPDGTTTVDVTGVPNWNNATVTGGGTVTLVDGMGSTTITVTSEDGTATLEYTVEIYTSIFATNTNFYLVHEMSGLVATESGAAFNQIVLADAVYQDSSQIWHFEESGVDGQYFIRNLDGNYIATSRTSANDYDLEVYPDLPSVDLDSARYMVHEFEPGRFRITSVKSNQLNPGDDMLGTNNGLLGSAFFNDKWHSTANDVLTVINIKLPEDVISEYDVHLDTLAINGVTLYPAFNPAYKNFFAIIPAGMTAVEVTATPADATATVTGAGTVDVSDGEGTITLTVTASDPRYTREYIIDYLADTELTLTHSYTFDDGTANDQVGNADGTVHGGTFADNTFISAKEGDYIILPADKIAINTYPSFTMEAHVITGANPAWTMYAYFGNTSGGDHCFFISLAGDNNQARAVLNLGDGERQAVSAEPGTGEEHHYVSVVTNDTIFWYVDGSLAQKTATPSDYLIRNISNSNAWFLYGAYSDPTWLGTTNEYNIYSGQMDAATVAARAIHFLGGIPDATLASLTVDVGELIPAFDPDVTSYSVLIPPGTTTVHVSAVQNDENSTVEGTGAVDVSSGSGSAAIVVTATNGSTKTYNIKFSTPKEFNLKHSYTFEDGTAADVVGAADGILMGSGTIANGAYTATANGDYIELPAADIAINTYSAITLEGFIYADVDNTGATMMAYFGGNENGVGGNSYFFTPDRWSESRTAITCGDITEPWNNEQGVTGNPVTVGEKHHVVSILTDASIKWYIDGALVGEAEVSGSNSIAGLSDANAWLCKGGYDADPTWVGTIDKFNIYEGEMDAATIAQHAKQYLADFALMHSYTFDDGTAADVVGNADGTLMGSGTIANGAYTAAANGDYIELPAADIAINTYSAITLEGFIYADVDNTEAVMMAYFGGNENGVGGNGYFFTPDRWGESRTAISCGNLTEPWTVEQGVTGDPVSVGSKHHVVSVLGDTTIAWYIDGALVGEASISGNNSIANLSNANAWLCKGGYNADPTWMGTIDEFNIYEGKMDAATIAEKAGEYLAPYTLIHSYTFNDGTAADVVGNADGTLMGNGTIANGAYTAAANGDYIELPAADIAINTYAAITLEGFIFADVDNTAAVMMAYFGGNENGVGGNGYFFTPDRLTESRTTISCGNLTEPWTVEQGVTGDPVSVGYKHHVVSVLGDSTIAWYIDGTLVGEAALSGENSIANLSNANAWLCKGGYNADPTWMGTIDEFNIYEGEMDAATIAARAQQYLSASDANLSALTIDLGVIGPSFDPSVTTYYVTVPAGTTSVNVVATPANANATVMGDGAIDVSSGSGMAAVVVTSEDETATKTYNIVFNTPGELTKMHSYTFEDGTAADVVGGADGTLMGNGTIENGTYTNAADGDYIELPAATIAINTYSAITLEAFVTAGVNDGWTMLAYFGTMGGWPSYWMSIARVDDVSMTTVDAGAGAFGTRGPEPAPGETHHYVSVLTDSTIAWYIDGVMVSLATTPENTTIAGITTDVALLCRGGYPDPSWIGDIHEFHIYEGAMDAITVADKYEVLATNVPDVERINDNIKVYPTYSKGDFKVETDGSNGMITVYNLTGKRVLQKKIGSSLETISVRDNGMYLMKVQTEKQSKTFKVFKTR